ncbi:hypothetical protein [Pedobacter antarcticus]|uniref:hypothetical protein n=1 Tax=Pedobacter antarcticus TaxID=34086 RepID=UPI00292D635D|nr:hypothetical protein [Pedobacter antarcticus]
MIVPATYSDDTVLDRLYRAFLDHKTDQLSDEDKNILARITEVDKRFSEKLLVTKKKLKGGKKIQYERPYNYKELVNWLIEKYDISHRQAYADIAMAKRFFLCGQTPEDKEFARGQQIEIGWELYYEAKAHGQFMVANAVYQEINKLQRLHVIDPEVIDREKMMPSEYIVTDDPAEIGFEKMENPDAIVERLRKSFKQNFIEVITSDAEQIDFDEKS